MPKSFLISRRRKLSSSATEPPQKSSRVINPFLHSNEFGTQLEFSVTSDKYLENHCNNSHRKIPGKQLLFSREIVQNEPETWGPNKVLNYPASLGNLRHGFTHGLPGNCYFPFEAATTENWHSSCNNDDTGQNSHFTTKKEFTKKNNIVARDNNVAIDNIVATDNNNNVKEQFNEDNGDTASEFPTERKDEPQIFVDQFELSSGNHTIPAPALALSTGPALKIYSNKHPMSPSRSVMPPSEAATVSCHTELPSETPTIQYLDNCIVDSSGPTTAKNPTVESATPHEDLFTPIEEYKEHYKKTSQSSLSSCDLNASPEMFVSETGKSHDKTTGGLECPKQKGEKTSPGSLADCSSRFAALEDVGKMTTIETNKSTGLSLPLRVSWSNGTGCFGGYSAERRRLVVDRGNFAGWRLEGAAEVAAGGVEEDKQIETSKMNEEQPVHRRRIFSNSSDHFTSCLPFSQTSCSPQVILPAVNVTSLSQPPKKITKCQYRTSSEAPHDAQILQAGESCLKNGTHTPLWQPYSKSLYPLLHQDQPNRSTSKSLSPLLHQDQPNRSTSKSPLNTKASPVLSVKTNAEEMRNSASSCVSDDTSCLLVSQLLPSSQRTLVSNQETKNESKNSHTTTSSAFLSENLSHQTNNKEIPNMETCEPFLLKHEESQPQNCCISLLKKVTHRKRRSKSFMISSIINDSSDSEEEENQPSVELTVNSNSNILATYSAADGVKNSTNSSDSAHAFINQQVHEHPPDCNVASSKMAQMDNVFKQTQKNHVHQSVESPRKIIQNDKKYNSDESLNNLLNIHKVNETNIISFQSLNFIGSPLVSRAPDAARALYFPSKNSNMHSILDKDCYQSSTKTAGDIFNIGSLFPTQKLVVSSDTQITNTTHSNANIKYLRLASVTLETDLLSSRIVHPEPVNVPHMWRRTVNGVHNPLPMRYHPMPPYFNVHTSALFNQSSLSPPVQAERNHRDRLSMSKHVDEMKDSFLGHSVSHSPGCDASSNASTVSPLISSNLRSPTSSHDSGVFQEKHGYSEISRQMFQDKDNLGPQSDSAYAQAQKNEANDCKSFKSILEHRNVKLECINGGNGIKNPLLNTDFVGNKLGRVPSSCPLSCPVCHLTFDLAKHLQKHLKSHREIKRFLCSFCGKGFNDTFDLKRHTRTHTGVRPYKCNQCDKAFTQRCSLESHCRKIHGFAKQLAFNERRLKVYVCEVCGHSTDMADDHYAHNRLAHPTAQLKRRVST